MRILSTLLFFGSCLVGGMTIFPFTASGQVQPCEGGCHEVSAIFQQLAGGSTSATAFITPQAMTKPGTGPAKEIQKFTRMPWLDFIRVREEVPCVRLAQQALRKQITSQDVNK